jgi:hypothetical protein
MGIIQDFKEFYIQRHNNTFDTNYLYVVEVGTFTKNRLNYEKTLTKFDTQMYRIMEELSEKEVINYLKKTYGNWCTDLPDYQDGRHTGVRYFKVPNSKLILPALTLEQAKRISEGDSIQGVFNPVPLRTFKNIPDYITLDEIKELEEKLKDRQNQMGR